MKNIIIAISVFFITVIIVQWWIIQQQNNLVPQTPEQNYLQIYDDCVRTYFDDSRATEIINACNNIDNPSVAATTTSVTEPLGEPFNQK